MERLHFYLTKKTVNRIDDKVKELKLPRGSRSYVAQILIDYALENIKTGAIHTLLFH
jgi:hypothetical protein